MLDTLMTYAGYAQTLVVALIAFLAVVAPITASSADNTVLDALRWLEDKVLKLILPGVAKVAPKTP